MKRILITLAAILLVAGALLGGARAAGELAIDWSSMDSGGSRSSGGAYVIDGTIGQADASVLSGSRFTVAGGYWVVVLPRARVLLPLIKRG
jgi:hypothetical protein